MPSQIATRIKNIQKTLKVSQTGIFNLESCIKFEQVAGIANTSLGTLDEHKKAIQFFLGFRGKDEVDGIYGGNTLTRIEDFLSKSLPSIPAGASMVVSKAALELIIEQEVSSRSVYTKKYKFPTWPGGSSGVTIGIGYDIGTGGLSQFTADWANRISEEDFELLATCTNKTGAKGQAALTSAIKKIVVPLDTALEVFYTISMPNYAKDVKKIYPGVEQLPPDAQGALLSLVYNRGSSLKDIDSRKEMRNIVAFVASGKLQKIANEIRNMKRLWVGKNLQGLLDRRDAEAALVENATFNILPSDCIVV